MVLCGTKNGSSMASLEETFEAPLFLRVLSKIKTDHLLTIVNQKRHIWQTFLILHFITSFFHFIIYWNNSMMHTEYAGEVLKLMYCTFTVHENLFYK